MTTNTHTLVLEVCDLSQPCLEINAVAACIPCGGQLVVPQRFDVPHQNVTSVASIKSIQITGLLEDIQDIPYQQVVLHVEKSRQATLHAAQYVWAQMYEGARLYVVGANALGIKSTIKKIATLCGQTGALLLNKRHARIQVFEKNNQVHEIPPAVTYQQVAAEASSDLQLCTRLGVFSVDALDQGTALLQSCLEDVRPAARILDMACGVGHLGIWALRHWHESAEMHVHFCDADARSMDCVRQNIQNLSLESQASYQWWAAGEKIDIDCCDLVLVNPPAHSGKDQDLSIARTMFQQAWSCLSYNGRMCLVANRQLSYEHDLRKLDPDMKLLAETAVFKVYLLEKSLEKKI